MKSEIDSLEIDSYNCQSLVSYDSYTLSALPMIRQMVYTVKKCQILASRTGALSQMVVCFEDMTKST